MGRVSQSRQNRSGKRATPAPALISPAPKRSRAENRRSSSAAAIQKQRPTGMTFGALPRSADIKSQYPDGIPTGLGGGNAAQSVPTASNGGGGGRNTSDTGRHSSRTNAKGVTQTGTNTGIKAMTLADANGLLSPGYQIENPFASNSLPGTSTSAYAGPGKSVPFQAGDMQLNTGAQQQTLATDLYAQGGAVAFGKPIEGMPTSGYIQQQQKQGSPNLTQSGTVSAEKPAGDSKNSGINWGARTMADNSDENVRRRHAMLDGDVGILQAMRNQEAIQGRVKAGGKHYQVNPNKGKEGENDFMEISADSARQRSWGTMSAQQVADKHMKKTKATKPRKDKPTLVTDPKDAVPTGAQQKPSAGVDFNTGTTFSQPGEGFPSFSKKPNKQY